MIKPTTSEKQHAAAGTGSAWLIAAVLMAVGYASAWIFLGAAVVSFAESFYWARRS